MASNLKLTNANGIGSEVSLKNPDTNNGKGKEIDVSKLTTYVDTVEDLASLSSHYETVIVRDKDRGGIFNAITSTTANNGTIFDGNGCSWERLYDGAVNVKWFGAKGDGIADDTEAIQNALNIFDNVYISKGTYIVTDTIIVGARGKRLAGETPAMDITNSDSVSIIKYNGTTSSTKTVIKMGTNEVGAEPSVDCTNNKLINIHVDANDLAGFACYGTYLTNDSIIRDCSFKGSTEYNLYVARSWYATYENLVSYSCKGKGLAFGMPLVLQDGTDYSSSWITSAPLELNQTIINNIRSESSGQYYSVDNAGIYDPTSTTHRMQGYGIGAGIGNGFTLTNFVSEKSGGVNLYVYSGTQPRKVIEKGYLEASCLNSGLDASSTLPNIILENIGSSYGIEIKDIFANYNSGGIYHTGVLSGTTNLKNIHQPRFLKSLDGINIYDLYASILKQNVYYQAGYYNTNSSLMSPTGYKDGINTRYSFTVDVIPGSYRQAIYLKSTNELSNGSYIINYTDGTSFSRTYPSPMPSDFELSYVAYGNVESITKGGGDDGNNDSVTFKVMHIPNPNI